MDDRSDKVGNSPTAKEARGVKAGIPATTRRKFNRGAAAGATVLLTLGNRVAWGDGTSEQCNAGGTKTKTKTKTKKKKACISQRVWESASANNPSFDPKGKHKKEVAKFQAFIDGGYDETFTDGKKFCAVRQVDVTTEVELECDNSEDDDS